MTLVRAEGDLSQVGAAWRRCAVFQRSDFGGGHAAGLLVYAEKVSNDLVQVLYVDRLEQVFIGSALQTFFYISGISGRAPNKFGDVFQPGIIPDGPEYFGRRQLRHLIVE